MKSGKSASKKEAKEAGERRNVSPREACGLMKRLLGIGVSGYFDAEQAERSLIAEAADSISKDYQRAIFLRETIRSARRIRDELSLPHPLGWPREALRVAGKIFGDLRGKFIGGHHEMTQTFLEAGCLESLDLRSDIAIISEPGDAARSCELAFEFSGACRQASYRFTSDDIEKMMREEMKRAYPENLPRVLEEEAGIIVNRCRNAMAGDAVIESRRTLDELQRGIASKYDDDESRTTLGERVARTFNPLNPDELRMVRDFLEDCVAWKVASASRGKNR